ADVVYAALAVGHVFVVAVEAVASLPEGVTHVPDPGRGQGAAVRAGLDAASSRAEHRPFLAANGDLPCVLPRRLPRLAGRVPSGGVGGARFLEGLLGVVDPGNVSIIGNVADDIEVLGLYVSPDLDSIVYTLTGLADEERGWGRADETWHALATVASLGGESWFR